MSTLTIRLPDDKHERLKELAKRRHISVNKLIDELATVALSTYDAKTRYEARAARGSAGRGLELLDILNKRELEDPATSGHDKKKQKSVEEPPASYEKRKTIDEIKDVIASMDQEGYTKIIGKAFVDYFTDMIPISNDGGKTEYLDRLFQKIQSQYPEAAHYLVLHEATESHQRARLEEIIADITSKREAPIILNLIGNPYETAESFLTAVLTRAIKEKRESEKSDNSSKAD